MTSPEQGALDITRARTPNDNVLCFAAAADAAADDAIGVGTRAGAGAAPDLGRLDRGRATVNILSVL